MISKRTLQPGRCVGVPLYSSLPRIPGQHETAEKSPRSHIPQDEGMVTSPDKESIQYREPKNGRWEEMPLQAP